MRHYLHVVDDDWCALYEGGELKREGHSISVAEVAEVAGLEPFTLEHRSAELTELGEHVLNNGGFPKKTSEALKLLDTEVGG